jgi:PAS domain S-box-containing protein
LLGKNIHPLIHHSRLDGTPYPSEQCQIYQSCRHGKNIHIDDELFWRSDGTCFPVEYRARPLQTEHGILGCVVTFTDITERKRAEEALRHERDFAESLIETAQVIVLVLDSRGCIVRFNRFMEKLSGYCLEEVRGQDWFNTFLPEQDRERLRQAFQRTVSDTQTITQASCIITHAGQQRLIEWYDRTLKGVDGQVMGVLAIGHDITEHKHQEAQLVQAQKMEVVGQLTGGIAHDFNNLLTIIIGNLDCLSAEVAQEAAPEIQELLNDAVSAARDAAELTQRLLALSRRQALKPDNIGLDKLVPKLKKFLRRILGEQFELHVNTPEDSLTVFADPARLENALLNLIINARDAMPRGGPLTIDIFRKKLAAAEVASSSLVPGSYVVMRITDSGTGMSPDVLSHAVEPFFTTKKSGQGTGLGLSMVYSFAKQSGGDLWLQSKPGLETRVSLLLPEVESVKNNSVMETASYSLKGGSQTILVVEDEPRVRKLLTRQLRNMGYRVIESENAQSAKQHIESQADVDLIFSDIVMPGEMNGYELACWARETRLELKCLLTTGADDSQRSRVDQSILVLHKPYTEKMLRDTIRSLFHQGERI